MPDTTANLKDSHFKDIFQRNFATLKQDKKEVLHPDGVGPTNSFLMILDAHTTTSSYLRNKANKNYFKLAFHESDSFAQVSIPPISFYVAKS